MRRALVFVLLAAALAVTAAGCGGGGDGRLGKSDYEEQVQAVDVELFNALRAVGTAATANGALAALKQCQAAFTQAADELDAISPPEDVEAEHEALASGVRAFPGQLKPIIARVQGGNRFAIAAVQSMPAMTKIIKATAGMSHKGYAVFQSSS